MFQSSLELSAQLLSLNPHGGTLVFSPHKLSFYPTFAKNEEIHILPEEITNLSINTSDTRTAELTLPRLFFLKWLAFAFPKRSGGVSTTITIQQLDRQMSFQLKNQSIQDLESKIIPYLDSWGVYFR